MQKSDDLEECNGDPRLNGMTSVSGRILSEDGNPSRGSVIVEYAQDETFTTYTDRLGFFEFFVPVATRISIVYSTNCFSETLARFYTIEESKSGIGPVDNFRFFEEFVSTEEDIVLKNYIVKSELIEFNISGNAISCDGSPVSRGRVLFENFWEIPIEDGVISLRTVDCFSIEDSYTFVVEDFDNQTVSQKIAVSSENGILDLGVVSVCEPQEDKGSFTIDDEVFEMDGYMSPDFYNRFEFEGEIEQAPLLEFSNENESIEVKSHANEVGSFTCQINLLSEGEEDRFFHSNNFITLELTTFNFSTFYGNNTGLISGTFTNIRTQERVEVSGQFTAPTIPGYGEYR